MQERYNVKTTEMCVCNNCEQLEDMGLECVTNALLQSPEGRYLEKRQRWSDFTWDDPERFEKFLGPDVNNFWHGPYQAREIAIPFIEMQNTYGLRKFDEADARLLVFINAVHDIQEAVFGDVPLPQKNADTDAQEMFVQRRIVSRILNVPESHPLMERSAEVQGGVNFLSRAFKAIEYAGYLQSGLRAWSLVSHEGLEADERQSCHDMGLAVLTRNVPKMERMTEFPYIQDLLARNWVAIEQARSVEGPENYV